MPKAAASGNRRAQGPFHLRPNHGRKHDVTTGYTPAEITALAKRAIAWSKHGDVLLLLYIRCKGAQSGSRSGTHGPPRPKQLRER